MAHFHKRYHTPGTAPGTLHQQDKTTGVPLKISLTDYTASDFSELVLAEPEECRAHLESDSLTWIHVQGDAAPDTLRQLGKLFGLHHLALEDVINTGQRPKVDDYNDQLFVVMAHPVMGADSSDLEMEQLSVFVGQNFVVSFHPGASDPFDPIRTRLRDHSGRLRERGADYLFYALIDLVIDEGFPLLERIGDEMDLLEERLFDTPTRASMQELHRLKRTMLLLRRKLWPQREVLNNLVRDESGIIVAENSVYFRDCYDHTIQIIDLIETSRETVTSLMDIYHSSVSNRLNEIMRVLTIIATIFIPLTFIVGVYGMNFDNSDSPWAMPELRWYYGYPLVWILMIGVLVGMASYFRRKKWL
ncbi:MAG: magnesium/cobalt transporter CorA [Gammaproteobacteria bacterium]|jgi:magnesium transporter|nr:magnesium/cobalt transporter CorA [Gammaproteobacteria bacterium]